MKIAFYFSLQDTKHCRRFESVARHLPADCELAAVGIDKLPPIQDIGRAVERVSVPGFSIPSSSLPMQRPTSVSDYGLLGRNKGDNAEFTFAMVSFLSRWKPDLLVADVGLEAAILGKMCGIPVLYTRQHDQRWDKGLLLAYEYACSLWAPYAAGIEPADCPTWIRNKTFYSGGFGQFSGQEKAAQPPITYGKGKGDILVMTGSGEANISHSLIAEAAAAMPDYQWHQVGTALPLARTAMPRNMLRHGSFQNIWPYLCHADLVVANADHDSIMDVAAAGAPSVFISADRPLVGQIRDAQILSDLGLSIVVKDWPTAQAWSEVFEQAIAQEPSRWMLFQDAKAALRSAKYIYETAKLSLISEKSRDNAPILIPAMP